MNRSPSIPLKGGDEYDALTGWRRVHNFRPGVRKAAKRRFNRRLRHEERLALKREAAND